MNLSNLKVIRLLIQVQYSDEKEKMYGELIATKKKLSQVQGDYTRVQMQFDRNATEREKAIESLFTANKDSNHLREQVENINNRSRSNYLYIQI